MRQWPVELRHGGVVLRPLRNSDAREWLEVRRANREWLRPWEATVPPGAEPGPPTFRALVRTLTTQAKDGRTLPWAVWWDESLGADWRVRPRLAGQLTVSGILRGSAQSAQVGYWVDERLAGRGIIPTAVALATDHCFRRLGIHRMEVAIRPENVKSLRVVKKLGFREEGLRPAYLHIDHAWRDHLVFALNAEEVPEGLLARHLARQSADTPQMSTPPGDPTPNL
ncbi:GNAT family protein [Mariniluteicoccus endophyticus]